MQDDVWVEKARGWLDQVGHLLKGEVQLAVFMREQEQPVQVRREQALRWITLAFYFRVGEVAARGDVPGRIQQLAGAAEELEEALIRAVAATLNW